MTQQDLEIITNVAHVIQKISEVQTESQELTDKKKQLLIKMLDKFEKLFEEKV